MKFFLNITPWAFLQPKKKESISPLEDQGDSVENPYPIISGVEMKLIDPWETATLLVKYSNLSSLKIYTRLGEAYLFDDSKGQLV